MNFNEQRFSAGRVLLLSITLTLLILLCFRLASGVPHSNSATLSASSLLPTTTPTAADLSFVTRKSSTLLLNNQPFRFAGANIYWLGLQQSGTAISYPSPFRVNDALATAAFMGETVVRSHSLGISVGCSLCLEPKAHVFNDEAFDYIDYAIASARNYHIKLIIPLVDNYHYYHGGKHTFTDWAGIRNENAFYVNKTVIQLFEEYLRTLLNHVNRYTGVAYKNDPTIMAWETGNELTAPTQWVQMIATFLKKHDSHHLVMDGNTAQEHAPNGFLPDIALNDVDIYTGHYYPPRVEDMLQEFDRTRNAGKVFIVGEYDWNTNNGSSLTDFLSAIERTSISGDLYWSLFPHSDERGFAPHLEHYTLHYPGDTPDMRLRVTLLRSHAFTMQGHRVPTDAAPGAPTITGVFRQQISWRGGFGAATYSIERSTSGANGPWTVICDHCVTDLTVPWKDPLWASANVSYRMRGFSVTGTPGPYSAVYTGGF